MSGSRPVRPGLHLTRGLKVGLYGGSFDPAHAGHAHVAATARRRLGLDRVLWLVTPGNPLKPGRRGDDLAARMAGARGHAKGPSMIVSDLEARIGTRFTLDTVSWLKARFPAVRFVWIMGADGLASFHRWRGWARLMAEIPIAVVSRPGDALPSRFSPMARRFAAARLPERAARRLATAAPPAWIYLAAPLKSVSSTALRKIAPDRRPGA